MVFDSYQFYWKHSDTWNNYFDFELKENLISVKTWKHQLFFIIIITGIFKVMFKMSWKQSSDYRKKRLNKKKRKCAAPSEAREADQCEEECIKMKMKTSFDQTRNYMSNYCQQVRPTGRCMLFTHLCLTSKQSWTGLKRTAERVWEFLKQKRCEVK